MCEHCGAIKTISHLLLECPKIKPIWDQIELWINTNLCEKVQCNTINIILGINKYPVLAHYIFIIVKHEIYKSRWTGKRVNIHTIQFTLKEYLKIEEYLSTISYGKENTLGKWSPIYNLLKKVTRLRNSLSLSLYVHYTIW